MIHVLGLLAEGGHGKSSAAGYLVDKYDARIVSFAGPLKRAAQRVMGFSDEQLYGSQAAKERMDPRYGFSARTFLQKLGTEGLRESFWDSIHLDAFSKALERIDSQTENSPLYIVDDCRFVNEALFLADTAQHDTWHSAVVKVVCSDAPKIKGAQHVSEIQVARVPAEAIAATVTSSRAQGLAHLFGEIDRVLVEMPRFRRVLSDGLARSRGRTGGRVAV